MRRAKPFQKPTILVVGNSPYGNGFRCRFHLPNILVSCVLDIRDYVRRMNLGDFINHRKECPICGNNLSITFAPHRKGSVRHEEDRMVFISDMNGIKGGQVDHKVGYSFGLNDNSFLIEFFTSTSAKYGKAIDNSLINKFKVLENNLGGHWFEKHCTFCHRYSSNTSVISFDYNNSSVSGFLLAQEIFGLAVPKKEDTAIMMLVNDYAAEQSYVDFWRSNIGEEDARVDFRWPIGIMTLELPLMPFVSKDETAKRLDKLLVFA